ncbi:MAG: type I-D CRISPR-associated protein Cas10d/Csc3 [Chloroflexi bacterium]|uniref:Type I-D CRISPR-associated protein Cas10d/Csc3 n=1 Tax=Candidatus Chlorohelix allophototropha TaxID=3003348 RepID=A0A8T7M4Y5_9CHLR|nr:type I-D CRISPR-associated protein Cas10d/Csc3 [Chloroflexota bacterium]WJW70376.1 type I-D CRISPR-associated protein Cas10d/Csc3 [Chloroflexota bacterium L227-S17]
MAEVEMFQVEVLKRAIEEEDQQNPALVNKVLSSFITTMVGPMLQRYSLYPAKGTTDDKFAHNADQMMVTHLLNGIFATLNFVREAQKYGSSLERLDDKALRLYILGYTMHDLDKILSQELRTSKKVETIQVLRQVKEELLKLNVGEFLPDFEEWLDLIAWLAVNTQRTWGINMSHTTFASAMSEEQFNSFCPRTDRLPTKVEPMLRDLCTFSDLMAFVVKSPEVALLGGSVGRLQDFLDHYSDFSLVYHKLADVRGFLSNLINNATMGYLKNIYGTDEPPLLPYLFFPNGVVYLNLKRTRPAPVIDRTALNQLVKAEIQEACEEAIGDGAGLGFSPLGLLKYPGYFHDFLTLRKFLQLFAEKAVSDSKENVAESTLSKMKEMQTAGRISASIALDYFPSARITMLGRFLINYLKLIDENLGKGSPLLKAELEKRLIARLSSEVWQEAQQIPSSGGLDYRYYWIAAQYLSTHPLSENELEELFKQLVDELLEIAGEKLEHAEGLQGPYLQYLPDYLDKNLIFGFKSAKAASNSTTGTDFAGELAKYTAAKMPRNSTLPCTICNSAYPTAVQEDASVLFQPWVYKNRLPLYKGSNAGGICCICSLELMLRQILLTDKPGGQGRIRVTGKKYESMEMKYFFIYPGFFFTTQTYRLASTLIQRMQNLKLFAVGKTLRDKETISSSDIFNLEFFNPRVGELRQLDEEQSEEQEKKGSMYLFNRKETHQYPGFIFFAKKNFNNRETGAAATTASWVEAAWLGLALPLVMGARVVVSEMYMPVYSSSADFKETVILDAPHQSVRYLLSDTHLRLDQLFGDRKKVGDVLSGSLAAFSRAIELHLDTEASGGDPKLGRFNRIARDLATDPLYVFSFLQEQVREAKLEAMPGEKAHHYKQIYYQLVKYLDTTTKGGSMPVNATRHEKAVQLYLRFYSPYSPKASGYPSSRAIVRPVDIAARSIIKDTLNLTNEEIMLETRQEIKDWLEIVNSGQATGRAIFSKEIEQHIRDFVEFFFAEVFQGYAEGQRSVLSSRLNRFKNGCEAAFADINRQRRLEREALGQIVEPSSEGDDKELSDIE